MVTVKAVRRRERCLTAPVPAPPPTPGATYRLTELVARSGVPARTIRYYQSQGVLPKPSRRGRDAVYGDEHLARLRLIGELRVRGLRLSAIRRLVSRRTQAVLSVGAWLGLDEALGGPWSEDQPRVFSRSQLAEALGDRGWHLVAELERARYVKRIDGDAWLVTSPTLLELALRLHDAGIDVELSGRARDLLRRRVARAADDVIALFADRAGAGFAGRATQEELATAVEALRPIAREAAGVILAQEVERAMGQLLRGGGRAHRRRDGSRRR
jgi:DNA-binding transcriptional MerR regulator